MRKRDEIEKGCLSRVPDDEPVFVLRARDRLAPDLLRAWAARALDLDVDQAKVEEVYALALQMEGWPGRRWPT